MTTTADPARRFSADMLAGVDEPVRRYFTHTITDGAPLPDGVHMAMRGHIKVGLWLPFTAEQTVDGRSFAWRARVGRGPLTPLRVTDQYAGAAGSTEGRLLGRVTLFHAHDADTSTSLPSNPRSACASTTTVPYKRSALCVGATPAGRRSNTSLSEARSTPSAASATSCFPAAPASAGGSDTPRYAPFFRAQISAVTPTLQAISRPCAGPPLSVSGIGLQGVPAPRATSTGRLRRSLDSSCR
jgi:hypothetical protein